MVEIPLFSTIIPLGIGAVYNSGWIQVAHIPAITDVSIPFLLRGALIKGIAFADQTGTLFVEQSQDGVTVHFQENYAVGIGLANAVAYNRRVYGLYVRVRYVNGAIAQGAFSLTGRLTGGP